MSQLQVTGEAKIRDIQGPVIANSGVITALDGAASQYVRGDGTLADFPTSTGGGSSVSYYLNSSVSQGTIGGVAYRELSKEPIIGAGTDITISANGYVASYITDANDPDVLSVPGGNFNCEFYFSVNNNTGNPTTYAELYKYDGTTFTLLGSSQAVPESLNQGTTIAPYYFAIPVATAALALTDRLAIRIYVSVDGRVVTLHTENSHLCQVVTTFSKGMVSLNNLTDQSQFITTGTSGTNFNIVSSGDTHTFNIPVASATNTGKLSSTDWSTFNAKQPAGNYVTLDTTQTITAAKTISGLLTVNNKIYLQTDLSTTGVYLQSYNSNEFSIGVTSGATTYYSNFILQGANRNYTFPNIDGTIALTSNIPANIVTGTGTTNTLPKFTGTSTIGNSNITDTGSLITLSSNVTTTGSQFVQNGFYLTNANAGATAGYTHMWGADDGIFFGLRNATGGAKFVFQSATSYNYTFPAATGTLALTSDLSAYLPLTGGTLTGALSGTSATFSTQLKVSNPTGSALDMLVLETGFNNPSGNKSIIWKDATNTLGRISISYDAGTGSTMRFGSLYNGGYQSSDLLTISSTGAATFSSSVTSKTSGDYRQATLGTSTGAALFITNTSYAGYGLLVGNSYSYGDAWLQVGRVDGTATAYNLLLQTSGGNVLIGTTSSNGEKLQVSGAGYITQYLGFGVSGEDKYIGQGNQISGAFQSYDMAIANYAASSRVIVITNTGAGVYLPNNGTSWATWSDERLKNINGNIENAVEKLLSIRAVNYSWKTDETNKENLGLIAQDVQKVFPEVIDESKSFNEGDDTEYLSVKYTELIPVLVKAIQEQQAQIEELKALINK